ncbi:SusC/RagA family TonB-linked outer membrane protein [Chitinophaga sp.]|uniref:SusC/RagA family TonB-linked outer membrane protein n=1 Tax=Chitinophaga sp. TaxID=1869181 RepID=UPI00262DCEF9|nr:SusC/RagA family TonB-linked outer membrane protein [uncultured Chitinophaga sp.]
MGQFNAGRCLTLAMCLTVGAAQAASANNLPQRETALSYQEPGGRKMPLKRVLANMEKELRVRINYMGNTVGNLQVDPPPPHAGEAVITYINRYLAAFGLEAEHASGNDYIIYKKEKSAPAPAAPAPARPAQPAAKTSGMQDLSAIPQQQASVHGTVTDEQGLALPGVTVLVKGTTNGTKTNDNGRYQINNVPPSATLVFSFIGYKAQEVKPGKRTQLDVKLLTDVQSMKDVVITGYQRIKRDNYTGSAVTITGEELKRFNPQNILSSIQAYDPSFRLAENNLAGSNPNALPNISIRGTTALPANTDNVLSRNQLASVTNLPLFILDGYPTNIQAIFDLDMNRVETITLLKDAAATAIYGSRASNGVVVIYTKAPKEGKLELHYNYELNVVAPDLTAYNVLNAKDKLEYERLAGLYTDNEVDAPDELEKQYYRKRQNVLAGVNTYWLSQPVQTELGHRHSVSLQGGTRAVKYGVDARYQSNGGVMKGSGRDRYSLSNTLSYNLGENNKFLARNMFTITQVNQKNSNFGSFSNYVRMNPYYPKTDSLGRLIREVDMWNSRGGVGNGVINSAVLNPMYESTIGNFDKSEYLEFTDILALEYNFNPQWRVRSEVSFIRRGNSVDKFTSPFSNAYYDYEGDDLKNRGEYLFATDKETQWDGNITLNYNTQIGGNYLTATGGFNMQSVDYWRKETIGEGFVNDRFNDINFARRYKNNTRPEGESRQQRLAGGFATVNYAYKNRYLLDATFRVDGSSKFGADSRMAPFWSMGMGWNLHQEAFLQGHPFINQLKLRATTGLTGDVSFPSYLSNTTYEYYGGDWYSTGVGAIFKEYGNRSLKWQRTQNYDLGLEASLWNDRIYLAPRYYYKHTRDLLADVNVPLSTGFPKYKENLGEMVNKGYELFLRMNAFRSRKWSVNFNVNLVHNSNEITKISNALKSFNDEIDKQQTEKPELRSVPLLRFQEGQSMSTIYAVRSLGIDPETGKEIFLKRDGTRTFDYNVKDIMPVGDETPVLEGNFGTSIVYGGFMVEVRFWTRLGGDIYNQTLVDRVENADPRYNVDSRVLSERWIKPGDVAFFKNIADQGSTQTSSRFVQEENRLELKSVFLSYDFPPSFYKRLRMHYLRLSANMNDLAYWSTVKAERGIDYPFARSITFTLSTRF